MDEKIDEKKDEKSKETPKSRKPMRLWMRVSLLFILTSMFFWAYNQFMISYRTITLSSEMVEALLLNKTELAGQYAEELGLTKEHLTQTGLFLDKLSEENEKLRDKIKLLDTVAKLEDMIGQLKEENALIIEEMVEIEKRYKKRTEVLSSTDIEETETGGTAELLSKYRKKLVKIKNKIREFKNTIRQERIAKQKERDRKESLLGNNGYFVRGGKSRVGSTNFPSNNLDIRINVKFVQ